jgi:hypothetical protein
VNSKFIKIIEEMDLYEFANIDNFETGIPNIVLHAYSQGDDKKVQHGARIKVSNVYGKFAKSYCFVIDIKTLSIVEGKCTLSTKEVNSIVEWIALNKKELTSYWNSKGEIITRVFLNSLKKVQLH